MKQPCRLLSCLFLMTSIWFERPLLASQKQPGSPKLGFVRVNGQYRVGKLLGTGASGEPHFDHIRLIFLNSLGRVFQGKDIGTGSDVALKIGHAQSSSSKLRYEYDVYTAIARSTGVPKVLWYSKEGHHEVIVLEFLGTSLGDLVREKRLDSKRVFLYASQMVHS